jgi:hypothetical protein
MALVRQLTNKPFIFLDLNKFKLIDWHQVYLCGGAFDEANKI